MADLRQIWLDEARDFTPWLAQQENLDLLSDALSLELEFEGDGDTGRTRQSRHRCQ